MAKLVYALFPSEAAAEQVVRSLASNADDHPPFAVQVHTRGPLDGDALPESGTTVGKNTLTAAGVGAAAAGATGGVVGSMDMIMGLDAAMGVGLGIIAGGLVGLLSGMMAGTKVPKPVLLEVGQALGTGEPTGKALVTLELDDAGHVALAREQLDDAGAETVGTC